MRMGTWTCRGVNIFLRTVLLAWLVTIATILIFVLVSVPYQRKTIIENLNMKARAVSVSLQDAAADAIVIEDYNAVMDRMQPILVHDESIEAIVVSKNNGFSLINEPDGWKTANLDASWRPTNRTPGGNIETIPLLNRRVFHFSRPLDFPNIEWGWIHVCISLNNYDQNLKNVYKQTGILALISILISLLASIVYAKKLVRSIMNLRRAVQKVTDGDFCARASIHSGDEVESLAITFNIMTDTLMQRDAILQSVRFAAQQFLASTNWESVIEWVLAKIGQAANASHVYVIENQNAGNGTVMATQPYEWVSPRVNQKIGNTDLWEILWNLKSEDRYTGNLNQGLIVTLLVSQLLDPIRMLLEQREIKSLILVPVITDGEWWGCIGIDDCWNERKWSDAEIDSFRAAADTLGSAVERQKVENALVTAKEAAVAASVAKSQFLANMSHEIRTPISVVIGMLKLLQRTKLDNKQSRYALNAVTSAETLLSVIGDILDFSKIEAGRLELLESPISVHDLVESAVLMFAEKAEQKGIELAYQVDEDVPKKLGGDPNRLRQILVNLIGNAIKFTDVGEVVIHCRRMSCAHEKVTLRFQVRDTGCGISDPDQAVIFDAFSQTDSSMKRTHGGTGLGLTISREFCKMMGGGIGVESKLGQGSMFWFTVQLKPSEPVQNEIPKQRMDLQTMRVLIVDDHEIVREIVREYILSWKGIPEVVSDSALALEKLRKAVREKHPFSVAILDWKMPGLDGITLAQMIKEEEEIKDTRLILMSSFVQIDETQVEKAGFAAYVPKPVRKSELYNSIVNITHGYIKSLPSTPLSEKRTESVSAGSKTILLAEDNDIIQTMVRGIIEELGYRCKIVFNGYEAVEMAKTGTCDMALMDCQMPKMDGYEATRAIREWENAQGDLPRKSHFPIAAMTAHAMQGDRERCMEAGMDEYLTKPVDPEQVKRILGKWLSPKEEFPEKESKPKHFVENLRAPIPLINYEKLLQRCSGKKELASRLVQKFLRQAREDLLEMEENVREGNTEILAKIAHRLRGAASMVSAESIQNLAADLVNVAGGNDLSKAASVVGELPNELYHLTTIIDADLLPRKEEVTVGKEIYEYSVSG